MAGFTGFPFSYTTSPSSSSTSSSASSAGGGGGIPSFSAASSVPPFGSTPTFGAPTFSSPFGPSSNGFSFPTPSNNSSMPSNTSAPTNDEATINKILEAIEVLEKLAKTGAFPLEKLDEIKKELEKKYPNIFKTKKPGQNNTNNTNTSSTLPNDPLGWENYHANILNQQQEFWKNYQHGYQSIQQQVNQQIQAQVQAQNQMIEQYMKMYSTSGAFSPNYFGSSYNYPSYNNNSLADAWKMAFEMIGKTSNDGLFNNNVLGNNAGFGTDGSSALSFLGSLLGGGFGFGF